VKGNFSIAVVCLLALAGCETSDGDSIPLVQTGGLVVPESQMADFCRTQASRQFGAVAENITTDMPETIPDGIVIRGRWNTPGGTPATGAFDCRYGTGGFFHGVLRTG
jgi:hypothetical protein